MNYISNSSFVKRLVDEHLKSYSLMYDGKPVDCTRDRPLSDEEKENFQAIAETLKKIREEMQPYPENYFAGRGIVLSVGRNQLPFAKVNLQMIGFTSTRLPVQVRMNAQ